MDSPVTVLPPGKQGQDVVLALNGSEEKEKEEEEEKTPTAPTSFHIRLPIAVAPAEVETEQNGAEDVDPEDAEGAEEDPEDVEGVEEDQEDADGPDEEGAEPVEEEMELPEEEEGMEHAEDEDAIEVEEEGEEEEAEEEEEEGLEHDDDGLEEVEDADCLEGDDELPEEENLPVSEGLEEGFENGLDDADDENGGGEEEDEVVDEELDEEMDHEVDEEGDEEVDEEGDEEDVDEEDIVVLGDDDAAAVEDEIEEIGGADDDEMEGSLSGSSEGLSEALRRHGSDRIAERRAQEAAEPGFAAHTALVRRLEGADGCFVCSICADSKLFATWDVASFLQHLANMHKAEDPATHTCAYCSSKVLLPRMEAHVNQHLQQASQARFQCPLCPATFHSNSLQEVRLHLRSRHRLLTASSPAGPPLPCANCGRRFPSCEALFRHLEAGSHSLCHCPAPGCLVKSRNRRALLDHMRRRHPTMGAGLLITTELVCGDIEDPPSISDDGIGFEVAPVAPAPADVEMLPGPPEEDASSLGGTEVSAAGPPQSLGSGGGLAESSSSLLPSAATAVTAGSGTPTGHVFCLRCPYCRLSTIRWPKFLRHQVTCPVVGAGNFFHRLYFCSECLAVSTERQLLLDHIAAEHVGAQLIEEEVLTTASRGTSSGERSEVSELSAHPQPPVAQVTTPPLQPSPVSTQKPLQPQSQRLSISASAPSPAPTSVSGSTSAAAAAASRSCSVELVSFPFDEEKFREQCGAQHDPVELDCVLEKMRKFCAYSVRILGKENHRRIPQCPECHKAFPYGLGDFKRHLMTVHLDVPREFIRDCLHFTQLPKGEDKFNELQEQLAMRNFRPKVIEPGRKRIPLPFSVKVLRKLTEGLSREAQDYLVQKMKLYSTKWALVDSRSTNKKYRCGLCSYASAHALADVRKHILGSHCGISTKHFRFCLQSSRLDPITFTLLSEDKLLRLANHVRRFVPPHRSGHLAMRRLGYMRMLRSPAAVRRDEDGGGGDSGDGDGEEEDRRRVAPMEEDEDTGIEGETAAEEEDEAEAREGHGFDSPSQVPISMPSSLGPCVFPGSMPSNNPPTITTTAGEEIPLPAVLPSLIPASGLLGMTGDGLPPPPPPPPVGSHSFGSSPSHLSYIPRQRNVDCFSVPNGIDFEEVIRLPFSEVVLRRLLAGTCDSSTEEMIVERMHVYSSYELMRMATGSRTLAFKCRCNRIFNTSRLPGRRMRPSTLADTRRHVMGVHARIPHEYLTVCCQASRISRENNWALYSDEMLLKLAADRPTKLMINQSDEGGSVRHSTPRVSRVAPVPASAWATPSPATSSSVASPSERSHNGVVKSEPLDTDIFGLRLDAQVVALQDKLAPTPEHSEMSNSMSDMSFPKEPPPPPPPPSNTANSVNDEDPMAYLRVDQAANKVDRVISLPYSMDALRYLTDGYCHPDYLETLRTKMEVYQGYKVYVTRRSGRRFFCCSGCSASSPHGLGDIRKHIVGVHAKVPERYKAAAMHCSRLSREDNSLLPLNVLLQCIPPQLSKMKWRGTVIQPIGGRGGLPASLVNAIPEFPSKPEPPPPPPPPPPPKETASSDAGESFAADGSLQDPPACPPPTNGMSLVVPPHLYIHKSRGKFGEVVYNCSQCRVSNRNIGPVRGHIVRDHMGLPGHKCFICGKLYNTKNDVLLHHKVVHTSEEFRLSQYSPYRYAMARVCLRSEAMAPSSAASSEAANGALPSSAAALSMSSGGGGGGGGSGGRLKRRIKDYREGGAPPPKRRSLGPSATGVLYPPGFNTATFPMPPPKAASSEQCYIVRRKGGYLGVTFSCNVCGAKAADWDRTRAHVALFHLGAMPFRCPQCGLEHWDHVAMAEHLRDGHQLEREAAILMNCLDASPRSGAFASNPEFERVMSSVKMMNQRHSGAT